MSILSRSVGGESVTQIDIAALIIAGCSIMIGFILKYSAMGDLLSNPMILALVTIFITSDWLLLINDLK
jgi:hypothetical protein